MSQSIRLHRNWWGGQLGGALIVLSLWSPVSARTQQPPSSFVIKNVRIFDGSRIIPTGSVVVVDGIITSVGGVAVVPDGAELIDGAGHTLLPGLIDSHTHAFGETALKQALMFGVTTELDMFADPRMAAGMRREQTVAGVADRADLFSAGIPATAPGGHGTQYGMDIPTISGPDDAVGFVDARVGEGSDYIKIIYDDGDAYGLRFPTISRETMAAVVASAHKRGMLAVVHTATLEAARDAVETGADGLVHMFTDRPPDSEFVRFLSTRSAFVIPTLTVLESMAGIEGGSSLLKDQNLAPAISSLDAASLKRAPTIWLREGSTYGAAEEGVRRLRAGGVPILAGTDAPNPGTLHGVSMHRELELLVNAGLACVEALAAATSVPAMQFRLTDRGRIEPGMRADLVLVKGDPATDIRATRRIARIWKMGADVDRQTYVASIEKMRAEAEHLRGQAAPAGSEDGLVSDFEGAEPSTRFGIGWSVSTDALRGGKSTAELKPVSSGANGSRGSLLIAGEVAPGTPFPWAGVMFSPGIAPMAPANMASKEEISFWVKGDGKRYQFMLFAGNNGFWPVVRSFVAGADLQEVRFKMAEFDGIDASELTAVLFSGGPGPGAFSFQIDDVRFK